MAFCGSTAVALAARVARLTQIDLMSRLCWWWWVRGSEEDHLSPSGLLEWLVFIHFLLRFRLSWRCVSSRPRCQSCRKLSRSTLGPCIFFPSQKKKTLESQRKKGRNQSWNDEGGSWLSDRISLPTSFFLRSGDRKFYAFVYKWISRPICLCYRVPPLLTAGLTYCLDNKNW